MKKTLLILSITALLLASCNSNDDNVTILDGTGITIADDVDCCSAEEALQVYKFLQTVKIIPELSTVVADKYNVFAYSKTGSFHVGYNEIFFVATKKISGNYVKNFEINNLTPLMHMVKMDMYHSTPASQKVESFNDSYLAVKRGWISFVMNTGESGTWSLSYDTKVLDSDGNISNKEINVEALPQGQEWIKSFKVGDETYYFSIVNPLDWATGTNTVQAYISKKNAESPKTAWGLATQKFVVDVVPTMPDMGNHTSPNNSPFEVQADGSYKAVLNLTMTGLWRLHLTVKDASGETLAGGDDLSDGFSSLYIDVTL